MASKREPLVSIFDPDRLLALHDLYYAWADKSSLHNGEAILDFFKNDVSKQTYKICYETALRPLSVLNLDEIPPFLPYLSAPESPEFPRQALGLHLLLDQAPRLLFSGVNERWTLGFFLQLAVSFNRELSKLPPDQQPQHVARWLDLGYSFEGAWLRTFQFFTAFVHSENLEEQLYGQAMVEEECRKVAEKHYQTTDPYRKDDEADMSDLALFPRLVTNVTADSKGASQSEALWRLCRIVRAHESIIRKYGRYPYRNGSMGRLHTGEELEFLKLTNSFEAASDDVAKIAREDVEAGVIRPLPEYLPGF